MTIATETPAFAFARNTRGNPDRETPRAHAPSLAGREREPFCGGLADCFLGAA